MVQGMPLPTAPNPQAPHPTNSLPRARFTRQLMGVALLALLSACGTQPPIQPQPSAPPAPAPPPAPPVEPPREPALAAFSARLTGKEAVPRNSSAAQGQLVAVLDRKTGLFRWKLTFEGLSGPVRRANFHGPAMDGEVANPRVALGQRGISSPSEGRAMLTPAQRADLLAGQWYVNLGTARFPEGEIRGQLIEKH